MLILQLKKQKKFRYNLLMHNVPLFIVWPFSKERVLRIPSGPLPSHAGFASLLLKDGTAERPG